MVKNIVNAVGNAMNTIPLTFNEHQISRTVIGGRENNSENTLNISVILLNGSGSHFKVNIFENLLIGASDCTREEYDQKTTDLHL